MELVEECISGLQGFVLREVETLLFPICVRKGSSAAALLFFIASRTDTLQIFLCSFSPTQTGGLGEVHTQALRNSLRQNPSFRIQLASTTAVSFSLVSPPSSNPPTVSRAGPSGAKSAPINRVVSHSILQPSVPMSRICAVSGGRRR